MEVEILWVYGTAFLTLFSFELAGTLVSVVDDNANQKRAKIILTFVLPFHLFYDIF